MFEIVIIKSLPDDLNQMHLNSDLMPKYLKKKQAYSLYAQAIELLKPIALFRR